MRIIVFLLGMMFLNNIVLAQVFNTTEVDSVDGKEIHVGLVIREVLMEGEFGTSFHSEYESYPIEFEHLEALFQLLEEVRITIVLGEWCSDSKREVPRFFKIIDHAGFPPDRLEVICVNRSKKAGEVNLETYKIEKVPTFIFTKDGFELGRITESPENTLMQDMIEILKPVDR